MREPIWTIKRRHAAKSPWWYRHSGGLFVTVVSLVVLMIIGFIFVTAAAPGSSITNLSIGAVAPATVLGPMTQISQGTFVAVGGGGLPNPIRALKPSQATRLEGTGGRPEIFYIDTEYCPYCAAERWSMIVALSRFGTFSPLHLTQSTPYDIAPNTDTFTFHGSSYSSQYVAFVSVEFQDRDGNKLDAFTPEERAIFDTYDVPPYVPTSLTHAIPFVSFANEYYAVNGGYDPQVLSGLSWQDIANKLNSTEDTVAKSIVGNANYITAAICQTTRNIPSAVCHTAPIPQIEQQLPSRTAVNLGRMAYKVQRLDSMFSLARSPLLSIHPSLRASTKTPLMAFPERISLRAGEMLMRRSRRMALP